VETQTGRSEGAGKFPGESLTMFRTFLITVAVQCLLVLRGQAVTLPFEKDAEPFYSSKFQVVWAATNSLPATVRVFKVVPASFSPTAISNLTVIGGSADLKQGSMNLYQPADTRLPLEKVPDKARAYELGMNLLARLEIPAAELMSQDGKTMALYSPGTRSHGDKATHKMITEPCTMGVEFRRALDDFECFGQQVRFQFESREKLTQLNGRWCGVQPMQSCPIASADQIVTWIKEGRARAQSVETTGQRWIKVADIKKVTIRDIEVCYDASEDLLPTSLYPYANLTVEVEFSKDDREMIGLFCPVIKEALSRAIRKSSEFNIFPSTLYEKQGRQGGGE
jgi:hypothetical protein